MSSRNSRDLLNPFKVGDEVLIPAGSKFTSTDPRFPGKQRTAYDRTLEVDGVDGVKGDTMIYEPEITHRTISGYYKRVVLSRAILRANNKPIEYRD